MILIGKSMKQNHKHNKLFTFTHFTFLFFSFGVCCVFVYESGATISQNCSYIRNPNYPNALTDTSSISYTVQKCDPSKK